MNKICNLRFIFSITFILSTKITFCQASHSLKQPEVEGKIISMPLVNRSRSLGRTFDKKIKHNKTTFKRKSIDNMRSKRLIPDEKECETFYLNNKKLRGSQIPKVYIFAIDLLEEDQPIAILYNFPNNKILEIYDQNYQLLMQKLNEKSSEEGKLEAIKVAFFSHYETDDCTMQTSFCNEEIRCLYRKMMSTLELIPDFLALNAIHSRKTKSIDPKLFEEFRLKLLSYRTVHQRLITQFAKWKWRRQAK